MAEIARIAADESVKVTDHFPMDPWTRSEQQARDLLEDILALPYHKEMREHYR